MNGVKKAKERLEHGKCGPSYKRFRDLYDRTRRRYNEYEDNPERMVQELSVHDG